MFNSLEITHFNIQNCNIGASFELVWSKFLSLFTLAPLCWRLGGNEVDLEGERRAGIEARNHVVLFSNCDLNCSSVPFKATNRRKASSEMQMAAFRVLRKGTWLQTDNPPYVPLLAQISIVLPKFMINLSIYIYYW